MTETSSTALRGASASSYIPGNDRAVSKGRSSKPATKRLRRRDWVPVVEQLSALNRKRVSLLQEDRSASVAGSSIKP